MECAERSKDNISHTGRQYNRHATFPFSLSLSLPSKRLLSFFSSFEEKRGGFFSRIVDHVRARSWISSPRHTLIELAFELVENEERKERKTTYRSTYRFRGLRRNNRPRLIGHRFFSPRSFEIGLPCKYPGESFHYKRLASHPPRFYRIYSARLYTEMR